MSPTDDPESEPAAGAEEDGSEMEVRSVLFVCVHNSSRSIMAEALARQLWLDKVTVGSAGTEPRGVHPMALAALEEAAVETAGLSSKSVEDVSSWHWDLAGGSSRL